MRAWRKQCLCAVQPKEVMSHHVVVFSVLMEAIYTKILGFFEKEHEVQVDDVLMRLFQELAGLRGRSSLSKP